MTSDWRPELVPLSSEELADLDIEEKRMEAWHLSITGHSQAAISRQFGVNRITVARWLDIVGIERRSRAENIERETERIIGTLEAVAGESWRRSRLAGENSMAGPSHLKNVIEAAKEIARLRGIEPTKRSEGTTRTTEVIVRIGGRAGEDPQFIDVGVRDSEAPALVEAG